MKTDTLINESNRRLRHKFTHLWTPDFLTKKPPLYNRKKEVMHPDASLLSVNEAIFAITWQKCIAASLEIKAQQKLISVDFIMHQSNGRGTCYLA